MSITDFSTVVMSYSKILSSGSIENKDPENEGRRLRKRRPTTKTKTHYENEDPLVTTKTKTHFDTTLLYDAILHIQNIFIPKTQELTM